MGEASVYKNIVRTGWVSSVNAADRTARVTFKDMGTTFVSGPLKVIKNPPFIPAKDVVQKTQTESVRIILFLRNWILFLPKPNLPKVTTVLPLSLMKRGGLTSAKAATHS